MAQAQLTAEDLRGEIGRRRAVLYVLAARVGMHPARLGSMLNGRLPLPADIAERVFRVLQDDATARGESA